MVFPAAVSVLSVTFHSKLSLVFLSLRQRNRHAQKGPDHQDGQGHGSHKQDAGRNAVGKEFTAGELSGIVGNGIGGRAHQKQERHAGRDQGREHDDFRGHVEIGRQHQGHGHGNGNGRHVHDEIGHDHDKEGNGHDKDKPVGILENVQPVYGQPFRSPGLPEAEPHAHGAGKQQNDVPGHSFKIRDVQDVENKEQKSGHQQDRGFVERLQGRHKGLQGQENDHPENDEAGQDLVSGKRPHFRAELPGFFLESGDGGFLGSAQDHDQAPDEKHHEPADGEHVIGELEKGDALLGDLLIKAQGHDAPGRAQQGDDGPGPGDERHADEQAFSEPGREPLRPCTGRKWRAAADTWWRPQPCGP